jgi:hypothetical protein
MWCSLLLPDLTKIGMNRQILVIPQYQIPIKSVQQFSELLHVDGRTSGVTPTDALYKFSFRTGQKGGPSMYHRYIIQFLAAVYLIIQTMDNVQMSLLTIQFVIYLHQ